jgi:DNA (cytosine-5)-methyltransferase 1
METGQPAQQLAAPPSERTPTTPADLSGWPVEGRERCDFYHRVREFPPDVAEWRKRTVLRVMQDHELFPAVEPGEALDAVRAKLDDGISHLREVARILAVIHGTPRLGNKSDPVDELVYIILARKTREDAYQRTFEGLKARFATWDDLLAARRKTVEKLVFSGGLSGKKTLSLFGALRALRDRFGRCTLEPARAWPDDQLEEFLCSLPEISRKSAYCIMMYSFGRSVLPADTHVGRVLARLGPYRELGLDLSGLDHKQLQVILADLVPPNLRYSLHVNLVAHGRDVCRSPRPLCDRCELRNLCATYRAAEVQRLEQSDAPTVVDLFSGAGGLSEGFVRAGFRVLLALDQDPLALRTYRLNHPGVPDDRIICRDVRELQPGELRRRLGKRRIDVLAGAPPCQGFSHAGFRSKSTRTGYRLGGDDRNFLFEYMVAAALELRPRLFLMENVPGMQSARKENLSFLETAARMLEQRGRFRTAIWRMNASAFGVPQDRIRYFLVASSSSELPSPPAEEYQDMHRHDFDVDALPPVTLDEAIFDLPARGAGEGVAVERWAPSDATTDPRFRRYLAKFSLLSESPIIYNHTVRYHNARDLELYALLRPGEDSIHAVERHRRADLMRYRRDVFDDKYARMRGDRPSKTIVAHLAKDGNGYVHPVQVRSISIREAARLQSFHDRYAFCGSPSDQWIQLGNAVPPVLAGAIARSFFDLLRRKPCQ